MITRIPTSYSRPPSTPSHHANQRTDDVIKLYVTGRRIFRVTSGERAFLRKFYRSYFRIRATNPQSKRSEVFPRVFGQARGKIRDEIRSVK